MPDVRRYLTRRSGFSCGGLSATGARASSLRRRRPDRPSGTFETYALTGAGQVLATGRAVGEKIASGAVRLIADARELSAFQPGEVLVARHTDPGWVQHFVNAAAVVVERGSVLSHSAIVSRELGIPCVVALADACTWLSSGDLVEVDGSTGVVRRIDV